ncbi:MAG TPA: MFS transporter [Steroidobacteraceae bacterium]|nr:MFS transporter [Steroidobacteraceae bacterium]
MLAAAIGLSIAGIAAFSILPVMIGAIADAQGLGASEAGLIAAADLFGFALASLWAGIWTPGFAGRRVAVIGLLAALIGNLLSLHESGFGLLLAARLLSGIGGGLAYSVAMSTLARSARPDRDFGLMVAAQIVYQVVALFTLPRLVTAYGSDAVFLVLAATVGASSLALLSTELVTRRADAGAQLASRSAAWLALAAMALFSLNLGALWTYVERIGVGIGLSSPQAGTILAAALALSTLGALGAAFLGDRWGRRVPLLLAFITQLISLGLLLRTDTISYSIGAVVYSLAWAFAIPYLYSFMASLDDSGRGIVLAPAAQAVGAAMGPAIAAALLSGSAYTPVAAVAAVALAGSMVCVIRVRAARYGRL